MHIKCLQTQLKEIMKTDRPVFLLGDINFDLLCPTKRGVKKYISMLDVWGLKQVVKDPTRSGSLLDHVVVRATTSVTNVRVVTFADSDHDVVIAEIEL